MLRKGAWSEEEDSLLRKCIEKYGEGQWHRVPPRAGLNRCRKSCRLRWLNYLRPDIKKGKFSRDEIDLIVRLHNLLGNRQVKKWSLIAGRLPGRTANDVKNYWNTHHEKKSKPNPRSPSFNTTKSTETMTTPRINVVKPRPRIFIRDDIATLQDRPIVRHQTALVVNFRGLFGKLAPTFPSRVDKSSPIITTNNTNSSNNNNYNNNANGHVDDDGDGEDDSYRNLTSNKNITETSVMESFEGLFDGKEDGGSWLSQLSGEEEEIMERLLSEEMPIFLYGNNGLGYGDCKNKDKQKTVIWDSDVNEFSIDDMDVWELLNYSQDHLQKCNQK